MNYTKVLDTKENDKRSLKLINQRGLFVLESCEFNEGELVNYWYECYYEYKYARFAFDLHLNWVDTGDCPQIPLSLARERY